MKRAPDTVDLLTAALLLCLLVAVVVAFYLYLRTAYRKGGWKEVRISFFIAIGALVGLYLVRQVENSDLDALKEAVNRLTR